MYVRLIAKFKLDGVICDFMVPILNGNLGICQTEGGLFIGYLTAGSVAFFGEYLQGRKHHKLDVASY